jgi:uridine kinase
MAYVVAMTGISGAGKTSVIGRTVDLLDNAAALYFDDYVASSVYPPDLKDWIARGAPVDEWRTPQMASDLRTLRGGPAAVILVEEPFGKLRREMAGLIDLAIHIDVPGDILLARRLLRRIEEERDVHDLIERLDRDMKHHLSLGRELDALGSAAARDAADIVVDGTKPLDEIARHVAAEVRQRVPS